MQAEAQRHGTKVGWSWVPSPFPHAIGLLATALVDSACRVHFNFNVPRFRDGLGRFVL